MRQLACPVTPVGTGSAGEWAATACETFDPRMRARAPANCPKQRERERERERESERESERSGGGRGKHG